MVNRFKKWGILLAAILYGVILIALLIWIKHLTPIEAAEITRIDLNKGESELILTGHHLPSTLSAVITPNIQRQETTLSSTFTWGKVLNLAVKNNHVWLANGTNGILSYNLTQPSKPVLEGILPIDGKAWKIAINGNNAFIAGGITGMFGIDISDPTQPKLAFSKYSDKIVLDVAAWKGFAIAVTTKNGIIVLDTRQIKYPEKIATIPLDGVLQTITLHHDKAYILGVKKRRGILHVIDIRNPYQPEKLATLELPSPCWDSTVIGSKLLVAMGTNGLFAIDIDNPEMPLFLPRQIDKILAYGLSVNGNDLLVASNSKYVYHYRNNNGHLSHVKTFITSDQCRSSAKYKNYIVAAVGKNGFSIIDSTKSGETFPVGIDVPIKIPNRGQIVHHNGITCVSTGSSLHLLQTTANGETKKYASVHFKNRINALTMDQQFAYTSLTNKELHIVHLAPTAQQRIRALIKWPSIIQQIIAQDNHLYIRQTNTGLFVIDINNIDQAQASEEPLIATPHNAVAIEGSLLYMATKPNGFKVYQINNGNKPTLVGELSYPFAIQDSSLATDLVIHKGYAFITNGHRGILSIDVSNPNQPKVGDSLDLSGFCNGIKIHENYAYVTMSHHKAVMIDISNPKKMQIVYELPSTKTIDIIEGKLFQLSDQGISITTPIKPLAAKQQNSTSIHFNLPQTTREGYYDLQLATQQQLTIHSDLLHYSPQQGWSMTRAIADKQNISDD